jgi:hypothetical protein
MFVLKELGMGIRCSADFSTKKLQDKSNDTPEKVNMPELTAFSIPLTLNSSSTVLKSFSF